MKRLFTLAILTATIFTISCSQTNQGETAIDVNAVGPTIKFATLEHNYGTITQGANGDCSFEFTNTGTVPLTLSNVKSSCGCTVPSWPKEPIAPGAKSVITVHYDTQRVGTFSKSITVTCSGSETPIILRISGKVEAAVAAN